MQEYKIINSKTHEVIAEHLDWYDGMSYLKNKDCIITDQSADVEEMIAISNTFKEKSNANAH